MRSGDGVGLTMKVIWRSFGEAVPEEEMVDGGGSDAAT